MDNQQWLSQSYVLDRFEDNDLAVLETDEGESIAVPRTQLPPEASEGDVLITLNGSDLDGSVHYAVDFEATEERRRSAGELRESIPKVSEGDLEL